MRTQWNYFFSPIIFNCRANRVYIRSFEGIRNKVESKFVIRSRMNNKTVRKQANRILNKKYQSFPGPWPWVKGGCLVTKSLFRVFRK